MSFNSLGLMDELIRAVSEKGYSEPTPIQQQAIPVILDGSDIMGSAQTGTGKTAAFILPLLHLLCKQAKQSKGRRFVRALILVPTRELAIQVSKNIETYSKYLLLKSTGIFGGVKIGTQITKLRQGVDILVATPGRLLDHAKQKNVDLSKVDVLVLDEADRMLDMGFIHDIRKIIKLLPKRRQNLLFSATFSNSIKKLADGLLVSPKMIEAPRRIITSEHIQQLQYPVSRSKKHELLSHLIDSQNWEQVLVFTRTKYGADRLTKQLKKTGISADAIHGNKSQAARTYALSNFKKGKVCALIATDIAARGLDINQLPYVVNFDLPTAPEDYVHRIGRTGRAGCEGKAISFVCIDEYRLLRNIERLIKYKLPKVVLPDFEPDPSTQPKVVQKKREPHARKRQFFSHGKKSSRKNTRQRSHRGQNKIL